MLRKRKSKLKIPSVLKKAPRALLPSKLKDPFLYGCKQEQCNLYNSTYPVRPRGNWNSKVIGIGEAAGQQEIKDNCTFIGPAGNLIDNALKEISVSFDKNFLMINLCLCQPLPPLGSKKQNRTPSKQEITSCRIYLDKIIDLYNPKLIVLVGGQATSSILDGSPKIGEVAGKFFSSNKHNLSNNSDVYSIWHPAFILRNLDKEKEWKEQLVKLRDYMIGSQIINN
jgi:DNA polymerase